MRPPEKSEAAVRLANSILERLDEYGYEECVRSTALGLAWAQSILRAEFSPSYFKLLTKDLAEFYNTSYSILHKHDDDQYQ